VPENGDRCFRGNISRAAETLHVLNREADLAITPKTAQCQWHGESMDYSTAIEAMQFLEAKAKPGAAAAPA
jgi:hypothetical protein